MVCLAAPLVLWVPEGLAGCGGLWQPVAGCGGLWRPIGCPLLRVWRHRCLMAGGLRLRCPDATLAGWLGWLAGWLAWKAGLAGWLQLAGCCWLAAAGWLTEIRKLAWKVVSHPRRSRRSADYVVSLCVFPLCVCFRLLFSYALSHRQYGRALKPLNWRLWHSRSGT